MSDTTTSQTFTPSAAFITDLDVGSMAPDEFGRLRRVAEVFGRGVTPQGAPFVCVNLERGECLVSATYAAGRTHSTVHGRCEVAR